MHNAVAIIYSSKKNTCAKRKISILKPGIPVLERRFSFLAIIIGIFFFGAFDSIF